MPSIHHDLLLAVLAKYTKQKVKGWPLSMAREKRGRGRGDRRLDKISARTKERNGEGAETKLGAILPS